MIFADINREAANSSGGAMYLAFADKLQVLADIANTDYTISQTRALKTLTARFKQTGSLSAYEMARYTIKNLVKREFLTKDGMRARAVIRLTEKSLEYLTGHDAGNGTARTARRKKKGSKKKGSGLDRGASVETAIALKPVEPPARQSFSEWLVAAREDIADFINRRDDHRQERETLCAVREKIEEEMAELKKKINAVNCPPEDAKVFRYLLDIKESDVARCRREQENAHSAVVIDDDIIAERDARRLLELIPKMIQSAQEVEALLEKI